MTDDLSCSDGAIIEEEGHARRCCHQTRYLPSQDIFYGESMIRLSKRLECVIDLVPVGRPVLDVGCDHAFTSIALVERGICPYCVASDVRPGPLLAAEKNIRQAFLAEKIRTVLADGIPKNIGGIFHELMSGKNGSSDGADGTGSAGCLKDESEENQAPGAAAVITGMGGSLIVRILEDAGPCLDNFDALVLSPQSEPDKVRRCLPALHFTINDERMVKEDGKYYTMILCERGEGKTLSKKEALYGPILTGNRDPVLHEYLLKQREVLSGIKEELGKHGKDGSLRYVEVSELLEVTDEALQDY